MGGREAIDVALAMFRRPAMVRGLQEAPLPEGMLTVIRIAAGADVELGIFSPEHARNEQEVREAAVFFLQQVLFHPQSDSHRLIGLAAGAEAGQVREHKRLLLKWLHPDRNLNKWENALFRRVVRAAEDLERQLGGPLPVPAGSTVGPSRLRHRSRRRLGQFAAGRVRSPQHWRARLIKHLRRFTVSAAVILLAVVAWGRLTETPLRSAFATLADGPMAWLRW